MQQALLRRAADALLPWMQRERRALHANPEIGLWLPWTQERIVAALSDLPLTVRLGDTLSSVVAVLETGRPGPAVLIRADMDGLPVDEATALPYASNNEAMHACGHDLHMAALLGAARLLCAHAAELVGTVVFMFQPGEEGYAGARHMIVEGVLDAAGRPLDAAYGIHVMADVPHGVFQVAPGPIMASSNVFQVALHGVGGHGSQPHQSRNPVPAIADLALAASRVATNQIDAFDPVVVTVTQLSGSNASNVIPASASMAATVRTLSPTALDLVEQELLRLADGIAAAHGLRADAQFQRVYPVTVNDAELSVVAWDVLVQLFGSQRVTGMTRPWMGSEDFSFVLERVPGAFVFLGAGEYDGPGSHPSNHSPEVRFDDALLADQAAALAALAWHHLGPAVGPSQEARVSAGVAMPESDSQ